MTKTSRDERQAQAQNYLTVTLRPDHDTTPCCDLCGKEDVSLATMPVEGEMRDLCAECEHCADPVQPRKHWWLEPPPSGDRR